MRSGNTSQVNLSDNYNIRLLISRIRALSLAKSQNRSSPSSPSFLCASGQKGDRRAIISLWKYILVVVVVVSLVWKTMWMAATRNTGVVRMVFSRFDLQK